jgi:hypothetical protein
LIKREFGTGRKDFGNILKIQLLFVLAAHLEEAEIN